MSTLTIGQELAAKSYPINRALLIAYANASGDQNPIHQNEEFAKSVGLPDVIAHGMLTMALAGKYISDIAGSAAVKEFSARFTKPVVVPARVNVSLVISAKVASLEGGLAKLEITATVDDVKVLGMAKATIAVA
jgi:acyl dehydratase